MFFDTGKKQKNETCKIDKYNWNNKRLRNQIMQTSF